jgi:antitoxin MazE
MTMRVTIEKSGDDLVLRIPAELAQQHALEEGAEVELSLDAGRASIAPVETGPTLEEMLAQVTDENRHELIDWGPPVGKEVW